jgi:hypothetical protein
MNELHLITLRCNSSIPYPRKYAKKQALGEAYFLLKGAIRLGLGWFGTVQDPVVEVGDEPLCARLTGPHESSVSEKFEVDITAINTVATELAVCFEIGADPMDRDVAHKRPGHQVVGVARASVSNMATTSFTLVGNSADSRELVECHDAVYCNVLG